MNWPLFSYLSFAFIAAGIALVVAVRLMPRLTSPSARQHKAELLVLGLVLALGLFVIYGSFYTGGQAFAYRDVGSDTAEQYVPYYLNLLDSIRDGSLGFWNFEYGLGTSFMSYQSWTLDPFNAVLIPLGLVFGNGALAGILVAVQSLKVIACGFLFDCLLTRYCRIPLSRVLGSSVFAFCGYLMLWGQHYWLGSVIVMATLLTVLLEALMHRWTAPRFLGIMLTVALTVMMSTYSGFMVLLYAAAYVALRLAHVSQCRTLGAYLRRFGVVALPVVCGLLVSLVTLVPYATLLLGESSRVTGTGDGGMLSRAASYLASFVPADWIPAILSRMLGSSLISGGADIPANVISPAAAFTSVNVYEFIQLGFSGASFILLGQFAHWAVTEAQRRDKVLIGIAAALVLLYCFNFFLPALSNVFVEPKYRSSFALAIPLCIALAVGWEKRVMPGRVARIPLYAASALTIGVLAWSLANTVDGWIGCAFFLAAVAILTILLAVFGKKPMSGPVLAAVCACVLATSVADGFLVTNNRAACDEDTFPVATEPNRASDTVEAVDWIRGQDSGLFRIEKLYTDWTRLDDSLIQGYQGASSYNSTLDSDIEEFYTQLWPGMIAGDTAYQEYLNDPDQPELLRMLGVKYLLAHDELPFAWCERLADFGDVLVYRVRGAEGIARPYGSVITESDANALSLEERRALLDQSVIVPNDVLPAGKPSEGTQTGIVDLARAGGDRLTGTMDLSSDSAVFLALPHTSGWTITVDGQEVETFRANYGFIGFNATAGSHTVEARFLPRNLGLGAAVGAVGALGGIAGCLLYAARRRRSRPAAAHALGGKR